MLTFWTLLCGSKAVANHDRRPDFGTNEQTWRL